MQNQKISESSSLTFGREVFATIEGSLDREWLVANGIGGYASSTICNCNTRRYHAVLIAALNPPSDRTLLVSSLDEAIVLTGRSYPLSSNEFVGGVVHPEGFRNLLSFSMDESLPCWLYGCDGLLIEKRLWMGRGENTTYVEYRLLQAPEPVRLEVQPRCVLRDYHWHHRGDAWFEVKPTDRGFTFTREGAPVTLHAECSAGIFVQEPSWAWNYFHRAEASRGLDDTEDLLAPGRFDVTLAVGESVCLSFSTSADALSRAETARQAVFERRKDILQSLPESAPAWVKTVAIHSDHFLVTRSIRGKHSEQTTQGLTVIAGYPWFTDWTRDTMIALPGLTIARGKPELAKAVLGTFAEFVNQAMLPNRFLDTAGELEFNSVDGSLLYFYALYEYYLATSDAPFLISVLPMLEEILAGYHQGTRHGIRVDPTDQLLSAGEPGVQLTWMDAKVGDWVVTPRVGKPVEINALWYNALRITAIAAGLAGKASFKTELEHRAELVRASFGAFWNDDGQYLYDVVGETNDATLRPNQLYAVGLRFSPLSEAQQRAVVDRCTAALLTPVGIRSLAADDPQYRPEYGGSPLRRDSAYHQGTTWAFLIGIYVRSHFKVYNNPEQSLAALRGLITHLTEAGVGQISEVFDGDSPHRPNGCYAQAWSSAELLYAWHVVMNGNTKSNS